MNNIKSAVRVLDILEVLSTRAAPMRFADLARELSIPKSSLHGLMGTLVSRGYVMRDEADRYRMVDGLRDGFNWIGGFRARLQAVAAPIIAATRDRIGETVFVCVQRPDLDVTLVCKAVSERPIRYDAAEQSRLPAYATVMGRVLLAHSEPDAVDAYFARTELHAFTARSVTGEAALRAELARIREAGYGTIEEEFAEGGCGIAAPIRDAKGNVVAVVDIATVAQRYRERSDEMRDAALETAAQISQRLGRAGSQA
ncbi:IclR family transcriptional regulator [Palleronia aestuarii]|uniref:IclR family transcriptional regulator n=1 Tax=Palleronia aestuarii TaxID=568105 RepID=A0A2W7PZF8_9RHOB|nr:IclR family transcriptional regulator [Palleronia aestuarii]PZX14919.1 IclR family transcriptional regulator [Palleronia aestuarii]